MLSLVQTHLRFYRFLKSDLEGDFQGFKEENESEFIKWSQRMLHGSLG